MLTEEDRQKACELVLQMPERLKEVSQLASNVLKCQKSGDLKTSKGISLLEVKNHQMLSYLINVTHLMHSKLSGHCIQGSPDIDRLTEIRTVLEKMRPVERKLKYQIDKLVNTATTGVIEKNDPLMLKPNINNLDVNDDTEAEGSSDEDGDEKALKNKTARLMPSYFDGDETAKQRQDRKLERQKKREANTATIRELRREFFDMPDEIREADVHRVKEDKAAKERQEYEENYFTRLNVTKRDKAAEKRRRQMSDLGSITNFRELGFLTGKGGGSGKKRKRSSSSHKKGSTKKRKFRN